MSLELFMYVKYQSQCFANLGENGRRARAHLAALITTEGFIGRPLAVACFRYVCLLFLNYNFGNHIQNTITFQFLIC